MTGSKIYPRFARRRMEEALTDTPVVLVHGPRQCGKTTLSRMVGDAAGYPPTVLQHLLNGQPCRKLTRKRLTRGVKVADEG